MQKQKKIQTVIDGQEISAEFIVITPAIARQMLKTMPRNRPQSGPRVGALVETIQRGHWLFNGATIVIDENGHVIDGQHRLNAIASSGESELLLVVTGVDPKAIETIDIGKPRSVKDTFAMHKEKNAGALAQIVLQALRIGRIGRVSGGGIPATPTEALEILGANPHLRRIATRSLKMKSDQRGEMHLLLGPIGGLWHHMRQVDAGVAEMMFAQLEDAGGIPKGSPMLYLRKRLSAEASKRPDEKIRQDEFGAWLTVTFVALVNGETLTGKRAERRFATSRDELPDLRRLAA